MKELTPDQFAEVRGAFRGKYDYDLILDGIPRVYESGVDFTTGANNFANCVKAAAKKRDLEVEVKIDDDEVYVFAHPTIPGV